MGDNLIFNSLSQRLILIVIFIGMTPIFIPYVFAMECQQNSDSSFELILDCIDTIDVKKDTMDLMYGDVSKFSSSLEGAKVYDVRFEDSVTFATLEIPLPLVNDLKSDVKFTKSSNYFLEFLNGDLSGSSLLISLREINGYDGTKNGASEVSFSLKINKVPCFAFGLKCGTAGDFEYALDRGLYLIESKAKELQGNLDKKNEIQINSISSDIPDWLKINAKWYSMDIISDKEFVHSIQFLIKEELIQMDKTGDTHKSSLGGDAIPEWMQKSTGWWADGLVSDAEFISGLSHLLNIGVI